METQEVLDKIGIAIADVEWTHDIGIAAALDVAMKRVKDWERLKVQISSHKGISTGGIRSIDYQTGYVMALSWIEGLMAEMENEDVACNTDGTERGK